MFMNASVISPPPDNIKIGVTFQNLDTVDDLSQKSDSEGKSKIISETFIEKYFKIFNP